ncbi:MAG: CDP-diacylglycerol--serine O-phosphatidyltransferase [Proteobacteria bacterium]|nr:CDP-diacylglycerol--serine O-phosphatidyltransferase [Pseudomonadota bacterium]
MPAEKERGEIGRRRLGGAVYILPNLITTGNLFFGFFSIVRSLHGQFGWASGAIFLAAIFDVLDGRVARLTKGTSEFGVQYDSLCDAVSFGVAPAFLMYQYGLGQMGRVGWVACFLFMACGALRLARFNVLSAIGKASGDFTGLPIPMAAITVASFVSLMTELDTKFASGLPRAIEGLRFVMDPEFRTRFLMILGPILALLMVSNIIFKSHKALKSTAIKPFRLLVLLVMMISLVAWEPEVVGFLLVFLYVLSGPIAWIFGWTKLTDDAEIFDESSDDDEL